MTPSFATEGPDSTFGIPRVPAPDGPWRRDNLAGVLIISVGAALPLAALPL